MDNKDYWPYGTACQVSTDGRAMVVTVIEHDGQGLAHADVTKKGPHRGI